MDTLKGIPEAVEAQDEFASSIEARDDALALLATSPGIGPPDLCWLQKSAKSGWSSAAAQPRGYFHFVLGRDTSGPAAVAAYFAEVTSLVEPMSLLQGLWYSSETKIERGFYCCFDPISRLDLRCELCIPGGVLCGALDPEGGVHEVLPELWRNCTLASFLRSELYDPELSMHAEVLHRVSSTMGMHVEQAFLQSVIQLYVEGTLPQSAYMLTEDKGCGCSAEHMDLVLFTIFHYFGRQWRWHDALVFFSTLTEVYPAAAVYTASSQRELGSFEDSFNTLTAAVRQPQAAEQPALLVALGMECLYAGQVQAATHLARQAIQAAYTLRPAWLLLARCYIRQGELRQALIVLNLVPSPPQLLADCQDILFTVPPPHQSITKPTHAYSSDPERDFARRLAMDAARTTGPTLPGAVLVNREPLDMSPWPDIGPYRAPRAVLYSAYGLLQEIVAAAGWDGFLELRARVFVMHSETSPRGEAAQEAQVVSAPQPSTDEALAKLSLQQQQQQQGSSTGASAAIAHGQEPLVGEADSRGQSPQQQQLLPGASAGQPVSVFVNATTAAAASAQVAGPADSDVLPPHASPDTDGRAPQDPHASRGAAAPQQPALEGCVVDLGSMLASSEAAKGPSSSKPTTIQGTPSLWSVVFMGGSRSDAGASGGPRAMPAAAPAKPAGPVAEGREDLEHNSASHPGPLCESTEEHHGASTSTTQTGSAAAAAATAAAAGGGGGGGGGQQGPVVSTTASTSHAEAGPSSSSRGGSDHGGGGGPARLLLRSVDSDREALMFDCGEELQQGDRAKRLCVRWLDELIIALWYDLQEYLTWKAQDADSVRATGKALADLVLEVPEDVVAAQGAAGRALPPPGLPHLQPGEWLRRGLLAERLCHDADALLAYRACIKTGGFNLVALTAIMRLAAHCGEAVEAVRCCHAALSWHCEHLAPPPPDAKPRPVPCPSAISCCLRHLVARMGIDAVRALVAEEVDSSTKVSGSRHATIQATFEKLLS